MLADHYSLTLEEPPDPGHDARRDRRAARRRPAVRHVAARALRRSDAGAGARAARARHRRARVRQPRLAPAADGRREDQPARVLSEVPHGVNTSITTRRSARCSRASWSRRRSSIASRPSRARPERPLTGWEMASRLSFFLWSSIPDDELRRAAAAGELSNPGDAREAGQADDAPTRRRAASRPSSSASGSASTTSTSTAASTPAASPSSPTK